MKYFIIIPIFGTLSHILAKIFFMLPFIIKRRRSFVCPSVNQFVYKLTLKEAYSFQIWYMCWRGFLRKSRSDFFFNLSRSFRMISKNIFLDFRTNYFFLFYGFFASLRNTKTTAPKFSIAILKRDFEKTLKWFFQK